MKKLLLLLAVLMAGVSGGQAQTAREVLDKCAAVVGNKTGVKVSFSMDSDRYGAISGTIMLKGEKFCAQTDEVSMWFDGKTQWTYLKKNDEVSVTNPTDAQLQAINPYNFINLYKQGYKESMTTSANAYNVQLTATDSQRKIQEVQLTIDKKSSTPTEVKMLQGKNWTTFTISSLQTTKLSDNLFRFNPKDYPQAEVIDLR